MLRNANRRAVDRGRDHPDDTHIKAVAIAITLFQPFERFVAVTQPQVNEREPVSLEIASLSRLEQLPRNLPGFIPSPHLAIEMT